MKAAIMFIAVLEMTTFGTQAASGGAAGGGATSAGRAFMPVMSARPAMPATSSGTGQSTTTTPNQPAASTPSPTDNNNNLAATNRFMANSNRFQGSSNLFTPTGTTSGTRQFNRDFVRRDHVVTANDSTLLVTLQGMIQNQLGIPNADTLPVRLLIENGAVTLVGFVPTAGEQQRILMQVEQTPGVVQVLNRMHVGIPSDPVDPFTPAFSPGQVDRAFSPQDQRLLQEVRQTAATQFGVPPSGNTLVAPQLPVRFIVQNGVVTVSGMVVTTTQGVALVAALQRTPGVAEVVDNLQVGGVNAVPQSGMTMTNQ